MRFASWLALLATLALWSGNWIVARAVRDDVAPGFATVGRLFIVLAVLLPFVFSGLRKKLRELNSKELALFLALGFTGGGLHLAMQWLGLHYTTATSGTLYLSTGPIFILLLAAPLLGERIGPRQWAGVAISFCGIYLIAAQGRVASLSFNVGDVLAVASMAMWGSHTVLLRLRRDPLTTLELLTVVCLLGLVFMAPWVAFEFLSEKALSINAKGVLGILYSAIFSLLIAYAGWNFAVRRVGAARAGVTLHLMPAFGVLFSALFLGEYPYWYHFAGVALILSGVALATFRASSASSSP